MIKKGSTNKKQPINTTIHLHQDFGYHPRVFNLAWKLVLGCLFHVSLIGINPNLAFLFASLFLLYRVHHVIHGVDLLGVDDLCSGEFIFADDYFVSYTALCMRLFSNILFGGESLV